MTRYLLFFLVLSWNLGGREIKNERFSASPTLESRLNAKLKFDPLGPNLIGYLKIADSSGINEATWLYVKTALAHYKKTKPIALILELNTPGGELFAAQKISDALKEIDTQHEIPVIAFINNWAISAGAMLAYSCRFIFIVKDASMGAAEPVFSSQTGEGKAASEKVNSAIRTDFANRASFFDRNPHIAEAMVDKDLLLVLRDHQVIRLDNEAQMKQAPHADLLLSAKGKLLTLRAEQLMQYGVADLLLYPTKLKSITTSEFEKGQWPATKSLLFQYPPLAKIPQVEIELYQMDWKTSFFVFLAHPIVSSLLMLGLMAGFYLEMSSPGLGFFGAFALLCLFFIALSSLSLEIAGWLELILLISGLVILLIDLFVLPTFGILGFFGALLFIGGLFGMFLPGIDSISFDFDTHSLNAAGRAFFEKLGWFSLTLILGFFSLLVLSYFIKPKWGIGNRLVLTGQEQDSSHGYVSGRPLTELPPIGAKGEAYTTLRPAGKIVISAGLYEATTSGNFIEKGTPIQVVKIEGNVVIVEQTPC